MRSVGFYWVFPTQVVREQCGLQEWVTAHFDGGKFWLPGNLHPFTDEDFERITAPITPPPAGYNPA